LNTIATLYQPGQPPQPLPADQFSLSDAAGRAQVTQAVADALGCAVGLVDVLASGPDYVAYSIFDSEGEVNMEAMKELERLTSYLFEPDNEDEILKGNMLIIKLKTQ
jgi:hypothetical protein